MALTRRAFFSGAAAGLALPVFRVDAIPRVREAARSAAGASADAVATDETYWSHIQRAFDVDRTIVNLNNGGCSPSPAHVLDAMIQDLKFSNEIPVYHMWTVLEPRIESVRRELAREFGCDPEELAITRNASESLETLIFGLDLKPGDEVDRHEPELRTDADELGPAGPPGRNRGEADLVPGAAALGGRRRPPLPRGDHSPDAGRRDHPHHQPDRPDSPGPGGRPHGPGLRGGNVRGRRSRVRALPVPARRPGVRLLRNESPQVAARSDRDRIPLRAEGQAEEDLAAHGRAREDGRGRPQVRGDRHSPRRESQRDRGGARLPPGDRGPRARPRGCGGCGTGGRSGSSRRTRG